VSVRYADWAQEKLEAELHRRATARGQQLEISPSANGGWKVAFRVTDHPEWPEGYSASVVESGSRHRAALLALIADDERRSD
jgi:hypothetical protein